MTSKQIYDALLQSHFYYHTCLSSITYLPTIQYAWWLIRFIFSCSASEHTSLHQQFEESTILSCGNDWTRTTIVLQAISLTVLEVKRTRKMSVILATGACQRKTWLLCESVTTDSNNCNLTLYNYSAGFDHRIRFWEAPSGICQRILKHPDSQVNKLEITPDKVSC